MAGTAILLSDGGGVMERLDLNSLWYERERQELLRAYEEIHGSTDGRIIPHDRPLPKLSDVFRCLQLAKTEASIWEVAQREAFFTEDQFDNRESILYMPLGIFTDWFRLKNDLYDHDDWAFSFGPTLRELAHPSFDGDEVAVLRRLTFPNRYIDDLAGDKSMQGSAI